MSEDIFGNIIKKKDPVEREILKGCLYDIFKNVTLKEFVSFLTNEFEESINYMELTQGKNACQKTSLLFNPHRLTIKTISHKKLFLN